jgi:hypothetical protein
MNLSKLPREKRNQLVLIALLTLMATAGLGFGLIRGQYQTLDGLAGEAAAAQKKLEQMKAAIRQSQQVEEELAAANQKLCDFEADMASGDLYSWVINSVRRFKADYKVEIPQYSPISATAEVNLLPHFPYKQAVLTIGGTARFHELGRFLADFENRFPHIRLLNLSVEANPGAAPQDQEMLTFRMDIVTLVKTNPT